MARIKWRDIEVEADTTQDVIILLDKLVTYQKIREVDTDALLNCPNCKSFNVSMISPDEVQCNICGSVMELQYDALTDESFIELELEDDEQPEEEN